MLTKISDLLAWAIQNNVENKSLSYFHDKYSVQVEYLLKHHDSNTIIKWNDFMIKIIYVSLWISIIHPSEKNYVVVYLKIDYQKKGKHATSSNASIDNIGMCKIFFSIEGILEKDELEIY